jgi:hypothetical protein
MRKFIYLAAAFALTACSNDEVIESTKNDAAEIKINVVTNPVSRTNVQLHSSTVKPESFYLWALEEEQTVAERKNHFQIENQKVVRGEANAEGLYYHFENGTQYWPAHVDDIMHVAAFHSVEKDASGNLVEKDIKFKDDDANSENEIKPLYNTDAETNEPISISDVRMIIKNVEVPDNWDEQHDILYATNYGVTRQTANEEIVLTFNHALALLQFQFKNESSTLYVEINKVTVNALLTQGNIDFCINKTGLTLDTYPWGGFTADNKKDENVKGVYCSAGTSYVAVNAKTDVNTDDAMNILVIPQASRDLIGAEAKATKTLDISCRVYNIVDPDLFKAEVAKLGTNPKNEDIHSLLVDKGFGKPLYVGANDAFREMRVVIPTPTVGINEANGQPNEVGWQAGKMYVYTIDFGTGTPSAKDPDNGGDVFVPLTFTLSINEWPTNTIDKEHKPDDHPTTTSGTSSDTTNSDSTSSDSTSDNT